MIIITKEKAVLGQKYTKGRCNQQEQNYRSTIIMNNSDDALTPMHLHQSMMNQPTQTHTNVAFTILKTKSAILVLMDII